MTDRARFKSTIGSVPSCTKHKCEMVPVILITNGKPRRTDPYYRCPQCVEAARAKVAHEKGLGVRRRIAKPYAAGSKCL